MIRRRWWLAAVSAVTIALPLLAARYPPSIDLPQHVAQVRLLVEAVRDPSGPYRIMWFTPYSGITAVLGLAWLLAGAANAGRVGLLLLGALWVAGAHVLAKRRLRSAEAATLASILFLGFLTYRGFCSFILGWPAFLVWLHLTTRSADTFRRRDAAVLLGWMAVIYVCHGLWCGVAIGWLFVTWIVWRRPARVVVWQAASVLPFLAGAFLWWLTLDTHGWDHGVHWLQSPLLRLTPTGLWTYTFGGLRGPVEPAALVVMLGWLVVGAWQHRRDFLAASDRPLLLAGALMFFGSVLLPSSFSSLLWGAERFEAPALFLLLLAWPEPRLRPGRLPGIAVAASVSFGAAVAFCWHTYETIDLSGLPEAIDALPPGSSVLGLDFVRTSDVVAGRPFTHVPAFAQVIKGGRLGYSFAEGPEKLVLYKDPHHVKWTRGLEFYSERVKAADVRHFEYVLAGAPEDAPSPAQALHLPMSPVTTTGLWRLYKVLPSNAHP